MRAAHEALKSSSSSPEASSGESTPVAAEASVETAVPDQRLRELQQELVRVPEGFTVSPKLVKMLERRMEALDAGGIDWGQAESLAFASLLVEGIPIRLTGQDTERGTFSHRHLVLHDAETGAQHAPIKHLAAASASVEAYNSPLSEYAALGFEYGYSVTAPEALVLWEAQFGDFINGAQIVIDQFLVSGLAKWRQTSRLTLLLPHGYEGNGPEHSSARLERFLQLAAQENIRVVNATTAAQYFHLLRRQALDPNARPLIVMTPKGLLRLREASSSLSDLAEGRFQPVLDDPAVSDRAAVTRLVLTSGKLYYDIAGNERRAQASNIAMARIEELYPFPVGPAAALVASYPSLREVVWAQEEPQNMGAWRAIRHRLEEAVAGKPLRYVGPAVAGKPERGVSDLAPARAGADRRGSAGGRAVLGTTSAASISSCRGGCLREPGAMPSRLRHQAPPVARRDPAPDVVGGQCEPDRAHLPRKQAGEARHRRDPTRPPRWLASLLSTDPAIIPAVPSTATYRPGRFHAGRDAFRLCARNPGTSRAQAPQLRARPEHAPRQVRDRRIPSRTTRSSRPRSRRASRRRWTARSPSLPSSS